MAPLDVEQAFSQLSSERLKQRRLETSRRSGLRALAYGALALVVAGVGAGLGPARLQWVVITIGAIGGGLLLFGALRLLAAAALARR